MTTEIIEGLKQQFMIAANKLYTSTINEINKIQQYRINYYIKRRIINNLIRSYNNKINYYYNKLMIDISNVNTEQAIPENQPTAKKTAFLTGINYTGTQNQLNGCINDAETFKNRILNNGFVEKDITVITDLTSVKADKPNILSNFTSLLKDSSENDLLVFFYSGHGSNTMDTNGDETDGIDECIVPCDLNFILDDELKSIIDNYLPKNATLVCFFDSCHSGTMLDLPYLYSADSNYETRVTNNTDKNTAGNVVMISGCMDEQTSMDSNVGGVWAGAMTTAFSKSVNDPENDTWKKLVTSMELYLKSNGYTQKPQLSMSGTTCNINDKHPFHTPV